MTLNLFVILLLFFAGTVNAADATTENTSARYQSLWDQYEKSSDLAWAYRLAVVAIAESNHDLASTWFSVLTTRNWRMGVDTSLAGIGGTHPGLLDIIDELRLQSQPTSNSSAQAYQLDDATLIPESIAYDPQERVLYAGSLSQSKVVVIRQAGGKRSNVVKEIGVGQLGAVYGIKLDKNRRELWVLHNSLSEGRLSGTLSVFSSDGLLLREYGSTVSGESELNDLCLTEDRVFVTDSRNDSILQGSRSGGALRPFVDTGGIPYANGIACNERSTVLFVAAATGVFKVDIEDSSIIAKVSVPPGYSLGGIDGLYVHGNLLVGIQNALGTPKVVIATLEKEEQASQIAFRDVLSPDFRIPTTGFIEEQCLYYIGNSSLDALTPDYEIDTSVKTPDRALILGLPIEGAEHHCAPLVGLDH